MLAISTETRESLKNRRFESVDFLSQELKVWAEKTNKTQRKVNWQFNVEKARDKLKSIYPKFEY